MGDGPLPTKIWLMLVCYYYDIHVSWLVSYTMVSLYPIFEIEMYDYMVVLVIGLTFLLVLQAQKMKSRQTMMIMVRQAPTVAPMIVSLFTVFSGGLFALGLSPTGSISVSGNFTTISSAWSSTNKRMLCLVDC